VDAGIRGLGTVGGGKGKLAATVVDEQFRTLLIGRNPFDIELLCEQMFRASQFYGRKGAVIEVISGIDLALWDILGKATGQPVYNLMGGNEGKDPALRHWESYRTAPPAGIPPRQTGDPPRSRRWQSGP